MSDTEIHVRLYEEEKQRIRERAAGWHRRVRVVGEPCGRGLIQGVPVTGVGRALRVAERCLHEGILILAEGAHADVLALTPPAVITDAQLEHALGVIEQALSAEAP